MGVQATPAIRDQGGCPFHHAADALFILGEGAAAVMEEEVEQSASPPPMSSCGRYILHRVCRFDTLAGVAIKYGVEVADVKRVNGLTADLQMFAHKTLRIPLPGRHPPAAAAPHSPPSFSPIAARYPSSADSDHRPLKILVVQHMKSLALFRIWCIR